mgnify:CR=1 FL=1
MSDLMAGIRMFLSSAWKFFQIDVPGTNFSFAVLTIGLLLVPVSLSFLSLALGFPVGSVDSASATFCSKGSRKYKVSSARKNDVR